MGAERITNILAKCHDFSDVFSGEKAGTLTPRRPYDLQINIKEGAKPVHRPIYSLSPQNSQPCRNSSRNIPGMDSSTQVSLHGAPPFYLSKRKTAASTYAWTSVP